VVDGALESFIPTVILGGGAVVMAVLPIVVSRLVAPRTVGNLAQETYECGMPPFSSAWVRYALTYYIYALIFIAFDVDALYLFPVAAAWTRGGNPREFVALLVFILILALAIFYAWGKGAFRWEARHRR
jgi:NADH-quinone oxidoreductase subunit A